MPVFWKSNFFCLSFFLGLTAFLPTTSSASVPKPAGIVTQVAGQATLLRVGLTDALPVKFRDRVFLQDKIHTQERTFVRVLLGGKALVTVGELSVLTITEDLDHATIDIESGTVGLSVARTRMKPGEYIEIRTPHAIAAVRGTTVLTQVTAFTNMAVLEGFIDVAGIATPNHTVPLTQLTSLKATGEGLGPVGKMSTQEIKTAHKHLQTVDDAPPGDSPLNDAVANDQSDQAAALAEALAPASDGKKSKLQAEESQKKIDPVVIQNIPPRLPTKELDPEPDEPEMSNELMVQPNEGATEKIINTVNELMVPPDKNFTSPQEFSSATFRGGIVNGTDTVTVTGTTTATDEDDPGNIMNTVNAPFNNEGNVSLEGGTLQFNGGGEHTGSFSTVENTTLEFGGGTHNISNDVTGPGTVLVSGGEVNINGGTYNITGNSTSVTGGIMTFNDGATLTSLGPLSVSGGLINFFNAQMVPLSTFNFSGGTVGGTQTVITTGITTVTGPGTKTITAPFNNEGPLTLEGGILRLLGNGTHTGSFTTQDGTNLEFGGGTHDISNNVTGPGTVLVSGGEVNINGGTYNITGNSTSVTGGIMTFNNGATLTSLGPLSVSGGLISFLSAQAVSLSSFNFSGGTVGGTQTVITTGITTVSGAGTKTITAPFNNEGPLTLTGGILRLLGDGTHTGSFTTQDGTTLEFGGGSHSVAGSSLSGPGKVSVTAGDLSTSSGNLFSLSEDLTIQGSLFQQTGGTTTISGDALEVSTHSLDASGTTDALFDISGGELTTTGSSSDLIESRTVGGTVTTGGSAVALSGTGSVTLEGANSSILQSFGAGTTITTGNTAVTVSGNALLDLDDQTNDVALLQNGGSLETNGSVIQVSDSAEARVGRSVGRLESGGQLTTTNGGHVLESTGGTTTMGDSVLDMIGSTSQADISGYVVYATGGQINGPDSNLVNVDAGELNTDGGIIKAEGDDRIILDNGTTVAIVDITSSDGTHDLGTTADEAIFNLSGTLSTDTPLTKKDGGNNDIAVDQTLLRTSGATVTAKRLLKIDKAVLDATAVLFQFLAGSDVTVDPGVGNGAIELTMLAKVTSTMPLLTLDNSMLTITNGDLFTLNNSIANFTGDFISSINGGKLIVDGSLASIFGNGNLNIGGYFISFGGTGSNGITINNSNTPDGTVGGITVYLTNGALLANLKVTGATGIENPGAGSITAPSGSMVHLDGPNAKITIVGGP